MLAHMPYRAFGILGTGVIQGVGIGGELDGVCRNGTEAFLGSSHDESRMMSGKMVGFCGYLWRCQGLGIIKRSLGRMDPTWWNSRDLFNAVTGKV